jgi:hypothetical protein
MKGAIAGLLCLAATAVLASPAAGHDLSANGGCKDGDAAVGVAFDYKVDRNGDLAVCRTPDGREYDNHVAHGGGGGGWNDDGCRGDDTWFAVQPGSEADRNQDLAVCRTQDGREYDNRLDGAQGGGGGGWNDEGCREGDTLAGVQPGYEVDRNQDLAVCRSSDGSEYDNR